MSQQIRRYVREKEEREFRRGYNEQELQASALRKAFFKKYILDFDINFYKTQEERDWAYIARREYRYDVVGKSAIDGFFAANVFSIAHIFATKRLSFIPYLTVWPLAYLYLYPLKFQKHNKKLFDMLNIGEQFELGNERNKVLRECNTILDTEDF